MSDSDSFIHEVTEEVRRDQMYRLWKKYAPLVIAGIVLLIAGTAAWTWWQHHERQVARALGGKFINSDLASVAQQKKLVAETDGAAKVIARLRLAAANAEAGKTDEAARLYREVGATPGIARAYGDLAKLEAVRLALPKMDAKKAISQLDPLAAEGAPYRLLALELRAVAKLNSGDIKGAHADLTTIIQSPDATRDTIDRAAALLLASGGEMPSPGGKKGES